MKNQGIASILYAEDRIKIFKFIILKNQIIIFLQLSFPQIFFDWTVFGYVLCIGNLQTMFACICHFFRKTLLQGSTHQNRKEKAMKKILSVIYTVVIVILLSGIAGALPNAAETFPVTESASMLILGICLIGIAEVKKKIGK